MRYDGSTEGRLKDKCPILGAAFWEAGVHIEGKIVRAFSTANGECFEVALPKAITIDGATVSPVMEGEVVVKRVAFGNLKGIGMAVAHAGLEKLQSGDKIVLTCTGRTDTGQDSDLVNFKISVDR